MTELANRDNAATHIMELLLFAGCTALAPVQHAQAQADGNSTISSTDLKRQQIVGAPNDLRKHRKYSPPDYSFTANYSYRHLPSQTLLDEVKIMYGDIGVRVDQIFSGSGNSFIANYKEDKFWFVDKNRKLYHEIPVQVTEEPSQNLMGETGNSVDSSGYLQHIPCANFEGRFAGVNARNGRAVEVWECWLEGQLIETHWYVAMFGLVVLIESSNGYQRELSNIIKRKLSPDLFEPPLHYRSVSIESFLTVKKRLESYKISKDLKNDN